MPDDVVQRRRVVAVPLLKINAFVISFWQLVVSIPRLSAPSCHLLGKINILSMRHLCLQSKWLTMMEITDVILRKTFP